MGVCVCLRAHLCMCRWRDELTRQQERGDRDGRKRGGEGKGEGEGVVGRKEEEGKEKERKTR